MNICIVSLEKETQLKKFYMVFLASKEKESFLSTECFLLSNLGGTEQIECKFGGLCTVIFPGGGGGGEGRKEKLKLFFV